MEYYLLTIIFISVHHYRFKHCTNTFKKLYCLIIKFYCPIIKNIILSDNSNFSNVFDKGNAILCI